MRFLKDGPGARAACAVSMLERLCAEAAARQARFKPLAGVRRRADYPEGWSRDMRLLPCSLKRSKGRTVRMDSI